MILDLDSDSDTDSVLESQSQSQSEDNTLFEEIEAEYKKIIGELDACINGLNGLEPKEIILINGRTLESIVKESIGPEFGSTLIKILGGE